VFITEYGFDSTDMEGTACIEWRHTPYIRRSYSSISEMLSKSPKPAFLKFFQVGTAFISQNVLRTTLFLSPLKASLSFS